ncbi:MAG: indole-3-glycerol phosphate synthase TrpC [Waterburya sp.]
MNSKIAAQPSKSSHILQDIFSHKLQEVQFLKEQLPLVDLQHQVSVVSLPRDFLDALRQNTTKPSLIAEVKKASPSKGVIRSNFDAVEIAQAYERGGASCLSVLTDEKFFLGSYENLRSIRKNTAIPLLCKEFIIDPYQIYLARVNGADAVLLIAALLADRALVDFIQTARHLGMNALVEVHTLAELDRVLALPNVQLIGINNRNLQNFSVDLKTTQNLLSKRQDKLKELNITIVSESGLHTSADLAFVAEAGAHAVLVGESLVKQTDLKQAVFNLLNSNSIAFRS